VIVSQTHVLCSAYCYDLLMQERVRSTEPEVILASKVYVVNGYIVDAQLPAILQAS
jgi:hypothetical protein